MPARKDHYAVWVEDSCTDAVVEACTIGHPNAPSVGDETSVWLLLRLVVLHPWRAANLVRAVDLLLPNAIPRDVREETPLEYSTAWCALGQLRRAREDMERRQW